MQKLSIPAFSYAAKSYCLLTKPGIIMGNVITTAGGFALASRVHFDLLLFLATLAGLGFIIGSACVFNNCIDREADEKMARTKNRPLVRGVISPRNAMIFAVVLGLIGTLILTAIANLLTVAIALFGFFVYVLLYSFSKYRSVHGTLIGSVAGAVPPVVGYCAVSNQLDAGAWIIFAMIVLWQMPHFFAIAIYRLDDYAKASIPVLPIIKGMLQTKIQMLLYVIGFIVASCMLTVFHYTGYVYLVVSAVLGFTWLYLCVQGFKCENDTRWARKMFIFSLVIVTTLCAVIPFNLV